MNRAKQASPALVEIRLYGHLRARFGKSYHLAVRTAAESVRALCVVVPGFREYVFKHSEPGYRVWLGNEAIQSTDELAYPSGRLIRFVPVTAGAGGDFGKIILGAALIGASLAFPGFGAFAGTSLSSLAMSLGVSMVLGGVSQMLAGSPASPQQPAERPDNQPSYAFNGAVNTTAQGNPVPLLFGRLRVGSQVISTGLSVSQLSA